MKKDTFLRKKSRVKPLDYKHFIVVLVLFLCATTAPKAQNADNNDAFFIRKIYDTALNDGQCYDWLHYLTKQIGARISGSPQAAAAVEYTRFIMDTLHVDTVRLQSCMVPYWYRKKDATVRIINSPLLGTQNLVATTLGNSFGTGPVGISGQVIEVQSLDEVSKLGREALSGKIVFYNRPFDQSKVNTFHAYGGAVDQRGRGPALAAEFGAIGAIVRSMGSSNDDVPHTGYTHFPEGSKHIPAIAISTNSADLLSELIAKESTRVYLQNEAFMLKDQTSYNVIGEIRGSEYPDEIILVGGHLDSWDIGEGAHDDGAGCVQSLDVFHIMKKLNYKPKRTWRCVMFMNEENGLRGALKYAEESNAHSEFHLAAIESDAGGFTPRGFRCEADTSVLRQRFKHVTHWLDLLEPYGLYFDIGGSGADISRLKSQKGLLFGLRPDSQRYFEYHHTAADTFETVSERELKLGAAALTSLVYLIDQYGLGDK